MVVARRLAANVTLALLAGLAFAGVVLEPQQISANASTSGACPSGWTFTERPAGNSEIPYPVYCEKTFTYSATTHVATLPSRVEELQVELYGAPGGVGGWDAGVVGGQSGAVGRVAGVITVSPGAQLQVSVGGRGANGSGTGPDPASGPAGGFSSMGFSGGSGGPRGCSFAGCGSDRGGAGTGAGGGAATLISFSSRIVVAAGAGGGGGANCFGCSNPNGDIVGNGRNGQTAASYRPAGYPAGGAGAGNNSWGFRFNASAGGGGGGVRGGIGGAASLDGGNAGLNSSDSNLTSSYVATSVIPRPQGDTSTGGIAVLRFVAVPVVASIDTSPAGTSNTNTRTFTVTFSEPVTGFGLEDLQLGGSSGSSNGWNLSFADVGDGKTYLVTAIHPNAPSGTLDLTVDATGVVAGDRVGVGSLTSTAVTIDRTPPAVSSSAFLPTANPGQFEVVITFSEPISTSASIDWSAFTFTGTSQGWSTLSPVLSGSTLKFIVSSSALVDDTTLQYSIGLGFVEDIYGNQLIAAYQDQVQIDLDAVAATFSDEPTVFSNSATLSLDFGAFVHGLTTADFSLVGDSVGCDITGLSGSGSSYQVTVGTCNAGTAGNIQVALTGSAALSLLGAPSPENQVLSSTFRYDNISPVAGVVSKTITGTRATYVVSFSEPVVGFSTNSISVSHSVAGGASGWSISNLVSLGNNEYSFEVANDAALNGNVSFTFNSGVTDLAGNALVSTSVASASSLEVLELPYFDPGPSSTIARAGSKIAPSFDLNSRGSFIYGVRVEITNDSVGDKLIFSNQNSITRGANSTDTVLYLEASTNIADATWETALQSIVFSTSSTATSSRSIEYHVKPQKGYDYATGHFFQFKAAASITIANASTSAAALSLFGLQGYLATPTDASQNAALVAAGVGTAWLGLGAVGSANDRAKILVGPGAGETIVYAPTFGNQGDSSFIAGDTTVYINTYWNGTWNDLGAADNANMTGYAVEFGGSPGDPELLVRKTHTHTLDITGPYVTRVYATDGDYQRGDEVELNVVFNEPVIVSGGTSPESKLEIMPGVFAEYVSGSGTTVLKYRYVVGAGVTASDLSYVATNSLTAGSRVFKDLVGNSADLTLPAPGASGSLESESNVELSGDVLTIRMHTPLTQSSQASIDYVISSAVAMNCGSLSASDFTFQNLNSASFQVSPAGNSTSCAVTLPHTISKASFGNATLGRSPTFEIASHDSVTYSNLAITSNRVAVTNPADAGKGEVILDETNLNRQRPGNLVRTDAIGVLPGASVAARDALRTKNIVAPPTGATLPELEIRGDFRQLTNMNEVIAARKQKVIRAGDAVQAKVQIPVADSANYKVVSYFDFNSGWLYAGEQDFDSNGEVASEPLVFTQPGEYFLRMYVVPKSATPGVQYPILPLSIQSRGIPQLGIGFLAFTPQFVVLSTPTLTQAQLDQIDSKQSLELVLIIEDGDVLSLQQPAVTTPPAATAPVVVSPVAPALPTPELTPTPEAVKPEPKPTPKPEPKPTSQPQAPNTPAAPAAPDSPNESAAEPAPEPEVEPQPEPSVEPEAEPEQAEEVVAAPAAPEPEATLVLESYDPFGSPEAIKETTGLLSAFAAVGALAAAAGAAAAAAAAAGAAGSAAASGSSGGMAGAEMNEDSLDALAGAEFELDIFADSKDRWGDKLALWAIPILSFLDRPTFNATKRVARYSPLVSKLLNDGSYLRAMLGSVSLLPTIAAIVLAVIGLTQNQDILLHPPVAIFIAILVLGLFDSFAGAMGVLVFILGSLPLVNAGEITDWRMLSGIAVAGFGPILLARSIRNFRRKAPRDASGWLDRIGDIGFASLMGGWISGLVLRALPALTGLAVPAADYVFEVQVIATIAIAVRIMLEDLAARFYPSRMDDLTPDKLPEPFKFQPAIVMVLRYLFYVFIASAFMGFGVIVLVAAALFLVPNLLGLVTDKLPRVEFLTKWLPTGLPAIAMILGLEIVLESTLSSFFGDHPDFSTIFIFGLLALIIFLTVLGMLARPEPNQPHWLQAPNKRAIYRVGGFVTFLLLVWLTSQL